MRKKSEGTGYLKNAWMIAEYLNQNEMKEKSKYEDGTTPDTIAANVEAVYRQIKYSETSEINREQLIKFLNSILNDNIINELLRIGDIGSNERIADSIIGMFKFLSKEEIQKYSIQLVRLAGANNVLILTIYKSEKEEIRKEGVGKISLVFKWVTGIAIVVGIIYLINNDGVERSVNPIFYGPIKYSIGELDPRFGVDRQKFLSLIGEATQVWEKPFSLDLFRYDSLATFKINLKFDKRQAGLLEQKRIRARIITNGKTFDEMKDKYNSQMQLKERLEEQYTIDESELKRRLDSYNSKIKMLNNTGGAGVEYSNLQQEQTTLDNLSDSLEAKAAILNQIITTVNKLAESLNEIIAQHNLSVKNYNGQFITGRPFEKGRYEKQGLRQWVDIYEFEDDSDLRITLVHEFGHALGFEHVDNPKAIMFDTLEKQNTRRIQLTNEDRHLLFQLATQVRRISKQNKGGN